MENLIVFIIVIVLATAPLVYVSAEMLKSSGDMRERAEANSVLMLVASYLTEAKSSYSAELNFSAVLPPKIAGRDYVLRIFPQGNQTLLVVEVQGGGNYSKVVPVEVTF